jgi:hypothetical protein
VQAFSGKKVIRKWLCGASGRRWCDNAGVFFWKNVCSLNEMDRYGGHQFAVMIAALNVAITYLIMMSHSTL